MSPVVLCVFALLAVGCGASENISPYHYNLSLYIDTDKDIFSGSLVIDAKVLISGAVNFVLHNNGLNISTVSVVQTGGTNIYSSMVTSAEDQTTMFTVSEGMSTSNNVQITITYQGWVSEDPTGLFAFWDSNKKFYMTNFYPIYARKVFPCLDEPKAAAKFSLSIILPEKNGQLIASTSLNSTTAIKNGYYEYQVNTTASIAPYSLFFTIGDWSSDYYDLPGSRSKLWLPPSLTSEVNTIDPNLVGALRSKNISLLLSNFIDHLNIFVAPTLSSETYSGLNTVVLRKDIIVENLQETTTAMQQDQLLKITYAVWRVFYGTAVRPANWGDIWLATSVPMYMAYKVFDEPEFAATYGKSDEILVSGLYERVFETSSGNNSATVIMEVSPTKPNEILSFVGSSGVEKGVYTLKTLESIVNPEKLRDCLLMFLFSMNNAAVGTTAFVNFIESSTNPKIIDGTLSTVMLPILSQPGYPLVKLTRDGETLAMSKTNFDTVGYSKLAGQVSMLTDVSNWLLPVTVTTSVSPDPRNASIYFFNANSNNPVLITGTYENNGWALLNLEGKGIMRVSFDPTSWLLFSTVANTTFSSATRAKLVADAFATAESEVQSWAATLKYLEALDSETHLAPWKVALAGFRRMWSWIYYTGSAGNSNSTGQLNLVEPFKTYVRARLNNIYQKLGPVGDNDDAMDPIRREIVAAMCEYGDSSCISNLTAQYSDMVNNKVLPSNNLLSVVVCNGLRNADINNWTAAFNNYIFSGSWFPQSLRNSHYSFLACPNSSDDYSEPINSFLSIVLLNSSGKAFPQDQVLPAVSAILNNPQHVDQVLSFFVSNQPKFNLSTAMQAEIMTEIGKFLTSTTQTATLTQFRNDHNVSSELSRAINGSIAEGNAKAQYILAIQSEVLEALNDDNITTEPPTSDTTAPATSSGTSTTSSAATTSATPTSTATPDAASAAAVSFVALLASIVVALTIH